MALRALHAPHGTAAPGAIRGNLGFAALFAFSVAARGLLITTAPLTAFRVLGDAQLLSLLYFGASLLSLGVSLNLPRALARWPRPVVFAAGIGLAVAGPLLFATQTPWGLVAGLAAQIASVAVVEVTLNLYVLDRVPRRRLAGFESLRLFVSAAAWMAGPWCGVKLGEWIGPWAPFAAASVLSVLLGLLFVVLRPATKGQPATVSPAAAIGRYIRQPRLRLAWALALGRSAWWSMFFTYGAVYLTDWLGYEDDVAALITSAVMGVTFMVPVWGQIGRRIGLRQLLIAGYLLSGATTLVLVVTWEPRWIAAMLLILASVLTSVIDGAGNVPFLRAVKPSQRSQMTPVFMTYRDASQLVPPGLFSGLLQIFALPAVFAVTGLAMLSLAGLCRYLPRRL